ncbi:MAG: TolC family protein, partial [Candidatus Anammoxibacter sp.]
AVFSIEIRAKEAQIIQAGLYPNPEIAVEAEDFGGENGRQEFDGVETTIWLSQLVPLGRKISKKKRVASLERDLSVWDYESKKLGVLTFTVKSFIEVLAAQERLDLAKELNTLAQDVLETVSARVKAGKGFPVEKTKSKVAFSTSVIKLKRAQMVLEVARRNLALIWGNYNPVFVKAEGDLYVTKGVPALNELYDKISQNPDMARWKHEIEMRKAVVKRENSNAIPDVTVSFGKRFFAGDNSDAFVMGFSMPLPVFNRNQGSRLEAKHRLSKAEKDEEAARLRILSFLSQSYEGLRIAFMEVETLRESIIPDARTVFESATEWYRRGKFSYLQVLDAQRTLFGIREQYINALVTYHQGVNNLERLIAGKIN